MLQFMILWSVLNILHRLTEIQKQLDGLGKPAAEVVEVVDDDPGVLSKL